jgi:hypothetical protein
MRLQLGFWAAILALVGAGLACAAPTQVAVSPGMLPNGREVLKDDFKSNTLGWDTYQGAEGVTDFEKEQYKINVKAQFAEIWANPDPKYAIPNDVIVEVQAQNAASNNNYYGIICRYQDSNNFYFLIVSSDGYYGIGKIKNGKHSLVNRTEMPPSDLIQDAVALRLRAECTSNRLALFANNTLLDEQVDPDFGSGGVGLIAGSYESEVTILFDNFIVYEYLP